MARRYRLTLAILTLSGCLWAQTASKVPMLSFQPVDTFHKGRLWLAAGTTGALYAGTVVALSAAWYEDYPKSDFHFFNDSKEWRGMDKMGHIYTAYFESMWGYDIARWTGMKEKSAILTGAGMAFLFQSTVEILDGFSSQWGFSVADMSCNLLGIGAFVAQQSLWGEQRIQVKMSSTPINYSNDPLASTDGTAFSSLRTRAHDLYGTGYAERFLKDYNAQTIWLSLNIHSFLHEESKFPKWLNVAVGYGAENLYGGFENRWTEGDAEYILSDVEYPRFSQFYIGPDIDFTKIPSKNPFVRTLLGMLNIFKLPGPVLEMSGEEGVKFRFRW